MAALHRYLRALLILFGILAVVSYALNSWVNPWRVLSEPWSSHALDPYRSMENTWNRTAKAGLASCGDWDAALFGSSRVDIGLDPAHPLFSGLRCVNLGLNAAGLVENERIFERFLSTQHPRLVVFAVDPGDLTTPAPQWNPTDFSLSPLDPAGDALERECRYRFGISTMAASLGVLNRAMRHELGDHTPQGFRRDSPYPEDTRKLLAGLYSATTYRLVRDRDRLDGLSPDKERLLREIVSTCRRRGIRLVLLLTPNHALFQASPVVLGGVDPYFARDRGLLAALAGEGVEVWDFLDAGPVNAEPLPAGKGHFDLWIDTFHMTPRLGNLVLDRIAGAAGDYGVRLEPATVAERVRKVKDGLAQYAAAHPGDMEFLHQALARYAGALPEGN